MSKKTFYVLMAVAMVSIPGFSAQERVVNVQNSVRVGYDDNIYLQNDKEGSGYITDILNLTGKFHLSGRTDALLYWQPEVRYRFDADPEVVSYQDLYAKLDHAMSQRTFLTLSDRLRYQMRDGRSDLQGGSATDQNYLENDLKGAVDINVDELSLFKVGGGYVIRRWDDSSYANVNDWDRYQLNGAYHRQLKQNKTTGVLSVNYTDQEYEGSRGGYQATSFIGGVDQTFNPNLSGFGRVGATMSTVDNASSSGSSDTTSPYLDAGLTYNPSERTSINGSMGYSLNYAQNSVYNAQDELNFRLGVRHDLTAKINISSSVAYIFSSYDSDYDFSGKSLDAEDNFVRINIRGTYQINRNNFIEAGYEYSDRWSDSFADYDRSAFDIGWRLRL